MYSDLVMMQVKAIISAVLELAKAEGYFPSLPCPLSAI